MSMKKRRADMILFYLCLIDLNKLASVGTVRNRAEPSLPSGAESSLKIGGISARQDITQQGRGTARLEENMI